MSQPGSDEDIRQRQLDQLDDMDKKAAERKAQENGGKK